VGFHAHNNLGLAIGNTLTAIEAGVDVVDGSLRAMGAGGGNAPTETLIAVLDRLGIDSGVDLYKIMDAAKQWMLSRLKQRRLGRHPGVGIYRRLFQFPASYRPGCRAIQRGFPDI